MKKRLIKISVAFLATAIILGAGIAVLGTDAKFQDLKIQKSKNPKIGMVDVKKLVPLHPFFPRVLELDREERDWRQGRYSIAVPILSPSESKAWEKAQSDALLAWHNATRKFSEEENRASSASAGLVDERKLSAVQSALKSAYEEELETKMNVLNAAFHERVTSAARQAESTLNAYARKLQEFRNAKLLAYRKALSLEFQKRVQQRAAELEETYLAFESNLLTEDQPKKLDLRLKISVALLSERKRLEDRLAALEKSEDEKKSQKQEALRRQLLTYRDQTLVQIAESLKTEAAALDQDAAGKLAKTKADLLAASKEALKEEEAALSAQWVGEKRDAFLRARKTIQQKIGNDPARTRALVLAGQGKALLLAQLEDTRLKIEQTLSREEKEILSSSKSYQETLLSIRKGNRRIASGVISALEREKTELLKAIEDDISKKTEKIAQERGIEAVLTRMAVGVHAIDLTKAVAFEMKKDEKEMRKR